MTTKSQHAGRIFITLVAGSCGLLALAYPEWRAEAQDEDYPCPEGQHKDEFGFRVRPGVDTPPSDDI